MAIMVGLALVRGMALDDVLAAAADGDGLLGLG